MFGFGLGKRVTARARVEQIEDKLESVEMSQGIDRTSTHATACEVNGMRAEVWNLEFAQKRTAHRLEMIHIGCIGLAVCVLILCARVRVLEAAADVTAAV